MSTELADLLNTIEEALVEVDRLRTENEALRKRVAELEAQLNTCKNVIAATHEVIP